MSKTLDFRNVRKQYLTVTLADEKNTTLMIGTPTKAIMNDLLLLESSVEALREDESDIDALDDLYSACARVMSRNQAGVKITKEYLEEIFDYEDITIFFKTYVEFVAELSNAKN